MHRLTVRTLFGTVKLMSQRFYTCLCQSREKPSQKSTPGSFSPLVQNLSERTTPEFRYVQARWSSLMSYGLTSQLLEEVLPLSKRISTATLSRCAQRIAQRSDGELGEEQFVLLRDVPPSGQSFLCLVPRSLLASMEAISMHAREPTAKQAPSKSLW